MHSSHVCLVWSGVKKFAIFWLETPCEFVKARLYLFAGNKGILKLDKVK